MHKNTQLIHKQLLYLIVAFIASTYNTIQPVSFKDFLNHILSSANICAALPFYCLSIIARQSFDEPIYSPTLLQLFHWTLSQKAKLETIGKNLDRIQQGDSWVNLYLKDIDNIENIENSTTFIHLYLTINGDKCPFVLELCANKISYQNKLTLIRVLYPCIIQSEKDNAHPLWPKLFLKGYTDYKTVLDIPCWAKAFLKYGEKPLDLIQYITNFSSLQEYALCASKTLQEYPNKKKNNPHYFEHIETNASNLYIASWNSYWKTRRKEFVLEESDQQLVRLNILNNINNS